MAETAEAVIEEVSQVPTEPSKTSETFLARIVAGVKAKLAWTQPDITQARPETLSRERTTLEDSKVVPQDWLDNP